MASRETDRSGKDMHEAAGADAKNCGRSAAPAELHAAPYDVGGIGTGRDDEHKAGKDEKPEIVNAEHFSLSEIF
jgi:hypothetical protein